MSRLIFAVALIAGLSAGASGAWADGPAGSWPEGITPPARPADVPPADWPFLSDGRLKPAQGRLEISTPTTHISRHGDTIEVSTPTETFSKHGDNFEISTPTETISRHGGDLEISTASGTVHRHASAAKSSKDDDDDDSDDNDSSKSTHHSSHGGGVVGIGLVLFAAYWVRRAFRKRRRTEAGMSTMPRPTTMPSGHAPEGASVAVLEQLHRLERRLALIETMVASPEFELQRGFRALNT